MSALEDRMLRISVVGCSGSGKTTLAKLISASLEVPHLELDSVHHQANWTPLPTDQFQERVRTFAEQSHWVIDGNYESKGILDLVWQRADTVVWVDPPRHIVMGQVLWRSLSRGLRGEALWNGNRERLGNLLRLQREENVVLWAATSFDKLRRRYAERATDAAWSHLTFHRVQSRREQARLLTTLGAST